jgi:hypothetical protein
MNKLLCGSLLISCLLISCLLISSNAIRHTGKHMTDTHHISYDIELTEKVIFIYPSQVIIGRNGLIVFPQENSKIGDYVSYRDDTYGSVFGRIVEQKDNSSYAIPAGIHEVIESGKIGIHPISQTKTLFRVGKSHEKDYQFCYGFNTENCLSPSSSIPIFADNYLDLTCDNCFIGLSGDVFAEIDIDLFRIKNLEGGFKNLHLKGGLGVDLDAKYSTSYGFDKTYPIISKFTIASFNLGPIPVDLWLEFPVEVVLSAGLNSEVDLKTGVNLDWHAGNMYVKWKHGHGVEFVKPTDNLEIKPYLDYSAELNGDLSFKIICSLELHLNNIFEIQADIIPETDFKLEGSLAKKEVCLDGTYRLNVDYKGHVEGDTFGQTIYDTGNHPLVHICKP